MRGLGCRLGPGRARGALETPQMPVSLSAQGLVARGDSLCVFSPADQLLLIFPRQDACPSVSRVISHFAGSSAGKVVS